MGVKVTYADIDVSAVIVEVAKSSGGYVPEVSYGTHFFQDLVEDRIYYLAVYPGLPNNYINEAYLQSSPNLLEEIAPDYKHFSDVVRILKNKENSKCFRVAMDRQKNQAVCYRVSC